MDFVTHICHTGAVAACVCWLVLGCDAGADDDTDERQEAVAAYQATEQSEAGDIAAVVNDREITVDEVELHLDKLGELYRRSNRSFDDSAREDKRQRVLQQLVDRELLRDHADHKNIEIDDKQVDEKLDGHIQRRFGSQSSFRKYLDSNDMTVADYRSRIRENVTLKEVVNHHVDTATIDDEKVRSHYDRIANRRPADDRIEACRLSVKLRGVDDDTHAQLRDDLADAAAHTDDLEQLAEHAENWQHEHDVAVWTRLRDTRWYEKSHVQPAASRTLFEADELPGTDENTVVDTSRGFDVYRIHDRRDAGVRELDEVEDLVRERARISKHQEQRRELLQQLRDDATIEIQLDELPDHPQLELVND